MFVRHGALVAIAWLFSNEVDISLALALRLAATRSRSPFCSTRRPPSHKPSTTTSSLALSDLNDFFAEEVEGGYWEEEEEEEDYIEAGQWDERIPMLNTVHLTGRIGSEPDEPKYFDDGKVVLSVSIATRRKYHWLERRALNMGPKDGETDWFRLDIWVSERIVVFVFAHSNSILNVEGSQSRVCFQLRWKRNSCWCYWSVKNRLVDRQRNGRNAQYAKNCRARTRCAGVTGRGKLATKSGGR